jgi:hypothetical protein
VAERPVIGEGHWQESDSGLSLISKGARPSIG